jgi:D-serine deaminase-like pyridoxal phosphate-dependent protein
MQSWRTEGPDAKGTSSSSPALVFPSANRRDGVPTKAFVPSLFVRATVMSRPTADRTIVGAGLNAQIDQKVLEPCKLTSNFTGLTIN